MIIKKNNNLYIYENKKNIYKYNIIYKIDSGISLYGWEVKSIRNNKFNINNSYLYISNNKEIFISNFIINPMIFSKNYINNSNRDRKLLIKKKDIYNIYIKIKSLKLILIILSIFIKNNKYIKICIGLSKKNKIKNNKYKRKNDNFKNY